MVSSVHAQDRGPVLADIIAQAEKMRVQVSTAESLYSTPFSTVQFRNPRGTVDLRFDYVLLEDNTEWFLNVRGEGWQVASELFNYALLPKKPARAQAYFLKQLEALLYDKRPFVLEIKSNGNSIQKIRALLSRQMPRHGEHLAFFPPPGFNPPALRGEGSEIDFWPLVVVEFPNYVNPLTFQYSAVLVPLTQSRYTGDLHLINTRNLENLLKQQERNKLDVEIRPASVQIFPSLEDPTLDKERLEIAAQSPAITTFASWFVPLWLSLYPNGRSLRIKKNLRSSMTVPVDISDYWGVRCGPFLSQRTN